MWCDFESLLRSLGLDQAGKEVDEDDTEGEGEDVDDQEGEGPQVETGHHTRQLDENKSSTGNILRLSSLCRHNRLFYLQFWLYVIFSFGDI